MKLHCTTKLGLLFLCLFVQKAYAQVIFDNGPLANSTGTGAGGADESILYTTSLGMGTLGFGAQHNSFNHVADDFTNTSIWNLDSIAFFSYQTNSPTTSTITGIYLRIWDGIPNAVGSNIVYGDTTTNRMIATRFSNVYRVTETTLGASTRPIMRVVCSTAGLSLSPGTYWLDWSYTGSLASGPWAPPRVLVAQSITGNGRQRIGSTWNNLVDGGTGTPAQGLPFIIYGLDTGLPVELLGFTGKTSAEKTHLLEWQTASEYNNKGFEIERGTDGLEYEIIGFVSGSISSREVKSYQYTDLNPLIGDNYYRLKQVDLDGKYQYSNMVHLYKDEKGEIKAYFSPLTKTFSFKSTTHRNGLLQLSNVNAQILYTEKLEDFLGEKEIQVGDVAQGIYFLTLIEKGEQKTSLKVVVE